MISILFLLRHSLPVDRVRHHKRGQPLCMEQYYRLFSSYRVPGQTKDKLVSTYDQIPPPDTEHIIVMCQNKVEIIMKGLVPKGHN